jgi:hypothetical protein
MYEEKMKKTIITRRIISIGLLILIFTSTAIAADNGKVDISYNSLSDFEIFNDSVEKFLQGSAAISGIRRTLAEKLREFELIENPAVRNYLIGQLYFVLAILNEGEHNYSSAARNFEHSLHSAEQAVSAAPFSDGYRLIADAYTHLMKYKGMVYQVTHGMKIKQSAELALSMDQHNDKAKFALALFLFNAPSIAGGDRQKSIEMFETIRNSRNLHPIDRYSVLIWLAIGYNWEENPVLSTNALTSALEMYPRNIWIDDLLTSYNL